MSTTSTSDGPADKDGMTLAELYDWVANATSVLMIPGDAKPTVVIKIGSGRIKKIEVKG